MAKDNSPEDIPAEGEAWPSEDTASLAAAFLDLWEKQVSTRALHGPLSPVPDRT